VLGVVQEQEHAPTHQRRLQRLRKRPARLLLQLQRLHDPRQQERGLAQWCQRHPEQPVRESLCCFRGSL